MSEIFERILQLVQHRQILVSDHGRDELEADGILIQEVYSGASDGIVVEEYPDYHKGPCVLVLQRDSQNEPVHVVWGMPKGNQAQAVIVTAYRPDPRRWTRDFRHRRQ